MRRHRCGVHDLKKTKKPKNKGKVLKCIYDKRWLAWLPKEAIWSEPSGSCPISAIGNSHIPHLEPSFLQWFPPYPIRLDGGSASSISRLLTQRNCKARLRKRRLYVSGTNLSSICRDRAMRRLPARDPDPACMSIACIVI